MTIGTDDGVEKYGTLTDLNSTSAAVADGQYSVAGDLATWTNSDDASRARLALQWQYASGTLVASAYLSIHARRINYTGVTDEEVPSDDYQGAYVGRFLLDDGLATATNSQSIADINLEGLKASQEYEFYIKNSSGVQISAGWDVEVVAVVTGPHA